VVSDLEEEKTIQTKIRRRKKKKRTSSFQLLLSSPHLGADVYNNPNCGVDLYTYQKKSQPCEPGDSLPPVRLYTTTYIRNMAGYWADQSHRVSAYSIQSEQTP
jgi:hypothetical protein